VSDPSETHNLAAHRAHAGTLKKLLARFQELSRTGVPMAGLPPPLLAKDDQVKCAALNRTGAFEPYGLDIPWPQPGNPSPHPSPPPPMFRCNGSAPGAACVEVESGFTGVVFSSAHACVEAGVCAACTAANEEDGCVHEFQYQLKNLTVTSAGDCCASCVTTSGCVQWQFGGPASSAANCALKSKTSAVKPGSAGQCTSGSRGPDRPRSP
jgi:hypothetical protein